MDNCSVGIYTPKAIVINQAVGCIPKNVDYFSWYSYDRGQVLAVTSHRAWRTDTGFKMLSPYNGLSKEIWLKQTNSLVKKKNFFSKGMECDINFRVYWGRWTWICTWFFQIGSSFWDRRNSFFSISAYWLIAYHWTGYCTLQNGIEISYQ